MGIFAFFIHLRKNYVLVFKLQECLKSLQTKSMGEAFFVVLFILFLVNILHSFELLTARLNKYV